MADRFAASSWHDTAKRSLIELDVTRSFGVGYECGEATAPKNGSTAGNCLSDDPTRPDRKADSLTFVNLVLLDSLIVEART